ncbi:MAG: TatD family hydrolase [Promethearchaeota archaeon]
MPADSHAHLSSKWFKDLSIVMKNARDVQVRPIINSCIIPELYMQSLQDAKQYPELYVSLGYSPAYLHKLDWDNTMSLIKKNASDIISVGEVGLDYHWIKDSSLQKKQRQTFEQILDLTNELKKPVFIHSRKAEEDVLSILKRKAETLVILHCFAGSIKQAKDAVEHGWLISIPTVVTNRKKHRKLAFKIPLENLVAETDAPFLSPYPYVEKKAKNEPMNVVYAIKEIAKLKDMEESDVDGVTTQNVMKIIEGKH